jgi:hypothetical protein
MARGGGDNKCCNPPPSPPLPSPEQWAQSIAANGGRVPKARPGTTIAQWSQAVAQSNGKVPMYSQKFTSELHSMETSADIDS